ncbi:MAG: hypothetical protein AB1640_25850 [bacterium]
MSRSSTKRKPGGRAARSRPVAVAALSLLVLAWPVLPAEAMFRAGAAKLTITPPECSPGGPCPGYSLAGSGYGRSSTRVHDDIYVRALAMSGDSESVVLVSVDVLGHLPDRIRKMQAALHEAYGDQIRLLVDSDGVTARTRTYADGTPVVANALIANAHVHASPDTIGIYGPDELTSGINPAWSDYVDQRVVEVVGLALERMNANTEGAWVKAAQYHVPGYYGFPLIVDNREPIILDEDLAVLQVVRNNPQEEVISTLVNYSGYPEMMGHDNTEITADFPGVTCGALEETYGGTAIWITRLIGGFTISYYDVNGNGLADDGGYLPNQFLNTFPGMTAYGLLLADVTREALDGAFEDRAPELELKTDVVNLPVENPFFKILLGEANTVIPGLLGDLWTILAAWMGMTSIIEPDSTLMLDRSGQGALGATRKVEVLVHVFKIGDALFATSPGQLFPELWTGSSPPELLAQPDWVFHPSDLNPAEYEFHPRIPGRAGIRDFIREPCQFHLGSTEAELAYLIPDYEFDHSMKTFDDLLCYVTGKHCQPGWFMRYEESDSAGREAGNIVQHALIRMISEFNAGVGQ